ncbi:UNVERIFIED_CONTAM: hypothetical protein FKN15_051223 [Acipenser sinensis]
MAEQNHGGYQLSGNQIHGQGIFPTNYVHLKKGIVSNSGQYETVVLLEDSIVTEVTSTLQEWAFLWKQLYVPFSVLEQGFR